MNEFRTQFTIAGDHPCLAGHFPGNPIVPGVLVLEAVAVALRQWRGAGVVVSGFAKVKFVSPLRPGERVDIILSAASGDDAAPRFYFRCESVGRLLAQGSIAI